MPGPKSNTPHKPGNRPDPNGNPRKANKKATECLASRLATVPKKQGDFLRYSYNTPGSQNRKK